MWVGIVFTILAIFCAFWWVLDPTVQHKFHQTDAELKDTSWGVNTGLYKAIVLGSSLTVSSLVAVFSMGAMSRGTQVIIWTRFFIFIFACILLGAGGYLGGNVGLGLTIGGTFLAVVSWAWCGYSYYRWLGQPDEDVSDPSKTVLHLEPETDFFLKRARNTVKSLKNDIADRRVRTTVYELTVEAERLYDKYYDGTLSEEEKAVCHQKNDTCLAQIRELQKAIQNANIALNNVNTTIDSYKSADDWGQLEVVQSLYDDNIFKAEKAVDILQKKTNKYSNRRLLGELQAAASRAPNHRKSQNHRHRQKSP